MGSSNRRYNPTIGDLRDIVSERWTPPKNPYDEVFPNIFIGDAITALSLTTLRNEGISHILNGALACTSCLLKQNCGGCVATKSSYYESDGIKFAGIQANDERRFPIFRYFQECSDFIQNAVEGGGKVLVHCREGISRSPTLVLAYLMMNKDMTAVEAIKTVRSKREIYPNDGFLEQICDLDLRLRGERSYKGR